MACPFHIDPFMTWFKPCFVFSLAAAEGTSIYVKHLPPNATVQMLEAEFKQFGAIGDGGIQVIYQRVRNQQWKFESFF